MERYVDGACIDILWQILTHAMSPCRLGYSGERLVTATESNKLLACSLSVNAHVTFMNLGDIYIRTSSGKAKSYDEHLVDYKEMSFFLWLWRFIHSA